jgi:hypothetical protein
MQIIDLGETIIEHAIWWKDRFVFVTSNNKYRNQSVTVSDNVGTTPISKRITPVGRSFSPASGNIGFVKNEELYVVAAGSLIHWPSGVVSKTFTLPVANARTTADYQKNQKHREKVKKELEADGYVLLDPDVKFDAGDEVVEDTWCCPGEGIVAMVAPGFAHRLKTLAVAVGMTKAREIHKAVNSQIIPSKNKKKEKTPHNNNNNNFLLLTNRFSYRLMNLNHDLDGCVLSDDELMVCCTSTEYNDKNSSTAIIVDVDI